MGNHKNNRKTSNKFFKSDIFTGKIHDISIILISIVIISIIIMTIYYYYYSNEIENDSYGADAFSDAYKNENSPNWADYLYPFFTSDYYYIGYIIIVIVFIIILILDGSNLLNNSDLFINLNKWFEYIYLYFTPEYYYAGQIIIAAIIIGACILSYYYYPYIKRILQQFFSNTNPSNEGK